MSNILLNVLMTLDRYTLKTFPDYSSLRTVIGMSDIDNKNRPELEGIPYILVTEQGDYLSVFEINGTFQEFDKTSLNTFIQKITINLTAECRTAGHKFSFVFERDKILGKEMLERLNQVNLNSANKIGLDLEQVLKEKTQKLSNYVACERFFLVCYTARSLLSSDEISDGKQEMRFKLTKMARFSQTSLSNEYEGLKIRHDAFISKVDKIINNGQKGLLLNLLNAHQVGRVIKSMVCRKSTDKDYQPLLSTDKVIPYGIPHKNDFSAILAPYLNLQLFSNNVEIKNDFIKSDNIYHASLEITLAPQQPEDFNALLDKIPKEVPFRFKMDIISNGMRFLSNKRNALSILSIIPSLKPTFDSIEWLNNKNKEEPVVAMNILLSTWADTENHLKRNLTLLQKSIQGWGVCDSTHTFGDPVKTWVSTILAASTNSGTSLLFPPLSQALSLLPLNRPASTWDEDGNMLFQTTDGKIFPVRFASKQQIKFTEIVIGASGTGKSVLANAINLVSCLNSNNKLPFLAIIDKGYTSMGLIELLRSALPDNRKDEVIGITLSNEMRKNPFDIQFGAKYPLPYEKEFIVNILMLLCTDAQTGKTENTQAINQILSMIVDHAFKDKAEVNQTKYSGGLLANLDQAIQDLDLELSATEYSWYELRDKFFEKGMLDFATAAHYQAMPELSDMQIYLKAESIKNIYGSTFNGNENALNYIVRCLSYAATAYPILNDKTQLSINPNTRVIAVDLNNVMGDTSKEGKLKSAIMYLIAMQISSSDFYLPQYQDLLKTIVNPMYWPLHEKRIEQLDAEIKTKFFDEIHNAKGIPIIFDALDRENREMRKFGVRTIFSTQERSDIPKSIFDNATSIYMMNLANGDKEYLKEAFKLSPITLRKFEEGTGGAASDGSGTTFLAIYRIKTGQICHLLKNTLGAIELWGLNSNSEDRMLRSYLYESIGSTATLNLLAEHFPSGSAGKLIDFRKKKDKGLEETSIIESLAQELLTEYFSKPI